MPIINSTRKSAPALRPATRPAVRPTTPVVRTRRDVGAPRARASITAGVQPIRNKLTKVERNDHIVNIVGLPHVDRRTVARVLDAYFRHVVIASVMPRGAGEYSEPGYFKVVAEKVDAKRVPARKAGEYANPFKGGAMEYRDAKPAYTKPATIKCKLRPQVKLRMAVLGQ